MGDVEGKDMESDRVAFEAGLFIFREYIVVNGDA
jgi:hypothetical protein